MTDTKCLHFDNCDAPICPKDEASTKNCGWFPDEEFCRMRTAPLWVKQQRKIAKKTKQNAVNGCFSVAMLSIRCVVTSRIKGLDPDSEISAEEQEEKWLKTHHPIREKTQKEKERYARAGVLGKELFSSLRKQKRDAQEAS